MIEWILSQYNYIVAIILMMMGLWAMIAKRNMVKKCIGMSIFQTGIILMYISMGAKSDSSIPIIDHHAAGHVVNPIHYANPLTQILMLTAIVVGVATLGVALSLIQRIYDQYGCIYETEVLEAMADD